MDAQNDNFQPLADDSTFDKSRGRVKVRKRIRVKRKKNPKKKIRKLLEKVIWTIVIVAFVITLFYLLNELDLSDRRYKKKTFHQELKIRELFSSEQKSDAKA
jgi:hypothetical protein